MKKLEKYQQQLTIRFVGFAKTIFLNFNLQEIFTFDIIFLYNNHDFNHDAESLSYKRTLDKN